jgi:hypothetical protein
VIATSGGAGAIFVANGNPTLTAYTLNQTFSFIASDHACATAATLNIDGLGPIPIKKIIGGSLVAIAAGDCLQNVPILLRAYGSPVSAFLLSPDSSTGWVSNVAAQSSSQTGVALAIPVPGQYTLNYYANQNGLCTTGSNSVSFVFNWTDGSSARTVTTGSLALGSATSASGYLSGLMPIYVGAGSVTYTSTVLGSCASGTSSYDLHAALTRLQ